jgi:hypothetical protein
MADVLPVIGHMIVCEDIPIDPANPRRVTLVNPLSSVRSRSQPPFPVRCPKLGVFVQLTECRGAAEVRLQIEQADNQAIVFRTSPRRFSFGNDPLKVFNMTFRLRDCTFPSAGLYWVRLWYNNVGIFQEPLKLEGLVMEQNCIFVSGDELIVIDVDGSQVAAPALPVVPPGLTDEEKAFADAVKRFQIDHCRAMLNWRDVYEIVHSLGYRKVEQPVKPSETNGIPQDLARPDAAGNETST